MSALMVSPVPFLRGPGCKIWQSTGPRGLPPLTVETRSRTVTRRRTSTHLVCSRCRHVGRVNLVVCATANENLVALRAKRRLLEEEAGQVTEKLSTLKSRCKRLYGHLIQLIEEGEGSGAVGQPAAADSSGYLQKKERVLRKALSVQEQRIDALTSLSEKLVSAIEVVTEQEKQEQMWQRQQQRQLEEERASNSKTEAQLLAEFVRMERQVLEDSLKKSVVSPEMSHKQEEQLEQIRQQMQSVKERYVTYVREKDEQKMNECEELLRKLTDLERQINASSARIAIEATELPPEGSRRLPTSDRVGATSGMEESWWHTIQKANQQSTVPTLVRTEEEVDEETRLGSTEEAAKALLNRILNAKSRGSDVPLRAYIRLASLCNSFQGSSGITYDNQREGLYRNALVTIVREVGLPVAALAPTKNSTDAIPTDVSNKQLVQAVLVLAAFLDLAPSRSASLTQSAVLERVRRLVIQAAAAIRQSQLVQMEDTVSLLASLLHAFQAERSWPDIASTAKTIQESISSAEAMRIRSACEQLEDENLSKVADVLAACLGLPATDGN